MDDLKKYTLDHYSEKWERYTTDKVLERVENAHPILEPLVQCIDVRPGIRILDLGVGPGTLPICIFQTYGDEHRYRIYGLDISKQAVIKAGQVVSELGYKKDFCAICGDMEHIPFSDGYFDVVVSNASINLIKNKNDTLGEIDRVIKPGGQFIIADCFQKEENKCCKNEESDYKLWSDCITGAVTLRTFNDLAEENNLIVVDTIDLTKDATSLVNSNKWDWPAFVKHDLLYFLFNMKKLE